MLPAHQILYTPLHRSLTRLVRCSTANARRQRRECMDKTFLGFASPSMLWHCSAFLPRFPHRGLDLLGSCERRKFLRCRACLACFILAASLGYCPSESDHPMATSCSSHAVALLLLGGALPYGVLCRIVLFRTAHSVSHLHRFVTGGTRSGGISSASSKYMGCEVLSPWPCDRDFRLRGPVFAHRTFANARVVCFFKLANRPQFKGFRNTGQRFLPCWR